MTGSGSQPTRHQAWAAVEESYRLRPDSAEDCLLGDQLLIHPQGAVLSAPAFYILGFNGGETSDAPSPDDRPTRSARRWFDLCARAGAKVGVSSWGITERCHWGSPNIPILIQRLGSREALLQLLTLHAQANLAMFRETPPLVVWVTGLGYMNRAIEDYGLSPVGEPQLREDGRRGVLWRQFASQDGAPWLFSRHPTGARFAKGEHDRLFAKLGELAAIRRDELGLSPISTAE